jgi:hypothetical protein
MRIGSYLHRHVCMTVDENITRCYLCGACGAVFRERKQSSESQHLS